VHAIEGIHIHLSKNVNTAITNHSVDLLFDAQCELSEDHSGCVEGPVQHKRHVQLLDRRQRGAGRLFGIVQCAGVDARKTVVDWVLNSKHCRYVPRRCAKDICEVEFVLSRLQASCRVFEGKLDAGSGGAVKGQGRLYGEPRGQDAWRMDKVMGEEDLVLQRRAGDDQVVSWGREGVMKGNWSLRSVDPGKHIP